MDNDDRSSNSSSTRPSGSLWKSRAGIALLAFLVIAGLLLVYEHRVHVLTGNGILIGLLAFCIGMHFFMHGGHGGHHHRATDSDRQERS